METWFRGYVVILIIHTTQHVAILYQLFCLIGSTEVKSWSQNGLLLYDILIQQEIQYTNVQHTAIVVPAFADVVVNYDLGKGVPSQGKGFVFRLCLLRIQQGLSRLDVDLSAANSRNEINLPRYLDSASLLSLLFPYTMPISTEQPRIIKSL